VKIVNWQKAMLLWFQEKVEVIEYHGDMVVRSAHDVFRLPSVMRLHRYVQPRIQNRLKFNRENVYARDIYQCQYCGEKHSGRLLTLDHVLPLSKGGLHTWENVVAACGPCNNRKGGRTPEQAGMPLLRQPFRPKNLPRKSIEDSVKDLPPAWLIYLPQTGL
jgi:5-methylcytosine-specific restriction endonuclease McrA